MMVRHTRRTLLLGMVTAAAGGLPLIATAQPRKRGAVDDPVADQIIRELGRIHRDERQRGTRLEHMRGTAGQLRLLALVMATNGTDDLVKEAARTKPAARVETFSLEMMRQELAAVGFETDGEPLFLPTLTQAQMNAGRRLLRAEGLSPTILRASQAVDFLAADASTRGVLGPPAVDSGAHPLRRVLFHPSSADCQALGASVAVTWVAVANICAWTVANPAICAGATTTATAVQIYYWYSCGF